MSWRSITPAPASFGFATTAPTRGCARTKFAPPPGTSRGVTPDERCTPPVAPSLAPRVGCKSYSAKRGEQPESEPCAAWGDPGRDSECAPRPLRQAECRPTSACSPQSRQSTTPTDVLSQSRSAASAICLRWPALSGHGAHERTTLSRVMRYLVPGFAVATSIESAPMRDVRETGVEIGAVAGRPAQHLARFTEPALRDHLLRAVRRLGLRCPMMHRHYDARGCFELTGQVTPIPTPALVDLVGRVPGAPPERSNNRSQPTTSCRGLGATCHPWGHGGCLGWRSRCIRRDTAGGAGRRC